jgi:hypothetical protein
MGKVARQMVEEAGVDVAVLLDKLVAAAGAEFTTFYYYTILGSGPPAWRARASRRSSRTPGSRTGTTSRP